MKNDGAMTTGNRQLLRMFGSVVFAGMAAVGLAQMHVNKYDAIAPLVVLVCGCVSAALVRSYWAHRKFGMNIDFYEE